MSRPADPFADLDPAGRQAACLLSAYLYQTIENADPWTQPSVVADSVASVSDAVAIGLVPAATTVDLARIALAYWSLCTTEAFATPAESGSTAVRALGLDVAQQIGVAHLLRDRSEARIEYAPRSEQTCTTVRDAVLLMAARADDTAIARDLHALAGTDADTPAARTADALAVDAARGRVPEAAEPPEEDFDRHVRRTMDAAVRGVFQQARHTEREKEIWRELDRVERTARADILEHIADDPLNAGATSWERRSIAHTLAHFDDRMMRDEWRTEAPRLATAAARHFDAVRAGRETAGSTLDSARMILADWSVQVIADRIDGYPWTLPVVDRLADRVCENLGIWDSAPAVGIHLFTSGTMVKVRDAVRLDAATSQDTDLDRDLHRRAGASAGMTPAAREAAAIATDRTLGLTPPGTGEGGVLRGDTPQGAAHRARFAKAAADAAMAAELDVWRPLAPPLLWVGAEREALPSRTVAMIERDLAWPGEHVVLVKPNGPQYWGAERGVVSQVRIERSENDRFGVLYSFAGQKGYHHAPAYGLDAEDVAGSGAAHRREQRAIIGRGAAVAAMQIGMGR